jgi:hypothetical protein
MNPNVMFSSKSEIWEIRGKRNETVLHNPVRGVFREVCGGVRPQRGQRLCARGKAVRSAECGKRLYGQEMGV